MKVSEEECDLLTEKMGGKENMISETSNTQRTGYTAAKIYHMYRHERDIYNNTHILFLVHNYINWYLTGGVAVMEPGDTSGTALWNPATQNWSTDLISVIDPDLAVKLPNGSTPEVSREYLKSSIDILTSSCVQLPAFLA